MVDAIYGASTALFDALAPVGSAHCLLCTASVSLLLPRHHVLVGVDHSYSHELLDGARDRRVDLLLVRVVKHW